MNRKGRHFKRLGIEYTRVGNISVLSIFGIHIFTRLDSFVDFLGFRFELGNS